MADAQDLKSWVLQKTCGFESHHRHHTNASTLAPVTLVPGITFDIAR